jgi:outer membrane protein TolC
MKLILLLLIALALMGATDEGHEKWGKKEISLDQAIHIALNNNHTILEARQLVERQRGVLLEATSQLFPVVSLVAGYEESDPERLSTFAGSTFGSRRNWTADVQAQQTIFAGGRNVALRQQQNFLLEASIKELEAVINSVLFEVQSQFYRVLLNREQIAVQEASTELLEQELRFEQERFRAGAVSQFNVLRAEVAVQNSKVPLIRARNEYRIALEDLRSILGMEDFETEALEVSGQLRIIDLDLDLSLALKKAFEQRSELRALELNIKAGERFERAERAGYLPLVTAFAAYGADSSRFTDSLSDYEKGWLIGVRTNWSIFDSFQTTSRVRQAKAQSSIARIALQRERLQIATEVRRSHLSLMEARELLLASKATVSQAEESLRLARSRFEAGAATQLDVLDTEVALTQARTNHVQALFDLNIAVARLERAVGETLSL